MIYLVYGEQYPLLSKRVKRLVKSILGDEIDEFSYVRMSCKEVLMQDIIYECSLLPFMGKKVVRIDEPYFLTSVKERVSIDKEQDYDSFKKFILSTSSEDIVDVIIVLETSSINKKSEIYKAIEKNGKIIFEEGLNIEALHQSDVKVGNNPSEGAHASLQHISAFLSYFTKMVESELKYNIDFLTETSPNVWWYDGQKIVFRSPSSALILHAIDSTPNITINEIAEKVGIVPRAVKKQLSSMVEKGFIQRRDTDKSWYVFASQSV